MKINVLGLIALLSASTVVGISNKVDAAVSNYQQSCNNIAINGNRLSAYCRKINGNYHETYIVLRGLENIDGVLQVTSADRISNYQLSCYNIRIAHGNELRATCRRRNGTSNRTGIVLNGIENINGSLRYTSDP